MLLDFANRFLTDFNLGGLSGFCDSFNPFNPSSPFRVWFLLVSASLELNADTQKDSIELDFENFRRCPVPTNLSVILTLAICFFVLPFGSRTGQSLLQKKKRMIFAHGFFKGWMKALVTLDVCTCFQNHVQLPS